MEFFSMTVIILATVFKEVTFGDKVNNNEIGARQSQSSKTVYTNLKTSIESIRKSCGEICNQTLTGKSGEYFDYIKKDVNCKELFANPEIDTPGAFHDAPRRPPKWLVEYFTYGGRAEMKYWHLDERHGENMLDKWSKEIFDDYTKKYREGRLEGSYGKKTVLELDYFVRNYMNVSGKHALVIGSILPWIEVVLLENGARKVTTLDYMEINSEHEKVETMTPGDLANAFLKGKLPEFDLVLSYSSVEHSGLGRYGDNLNPWGDLIAMARAWCVLKPGGRALIGVPAGPDTIVFNAHRIYGPLMFSHLFANWKQIYTNTKFSTYDDTCNFCYQPLHVLEKPLE